MQETVQAQNELVSGTVQDKGNVKQAVLEVQKRCEAVSTDPNPFLTCGLTQGDTFNLAHFQPRTEANSGSLVMGRVESNFLPPRFTGMVWT